MASASRSGERASPLPHRTRGSGSSDLTGASSGAYTANGAMTAAAISADGRRVACGSEDYRVYLLDEGGNLLWSYTTNGRIREMAISSDGYLHRR